MHQKDLKKKNGGLIGGEILQRSSPSTFWRSTCPESSLHYTIIVLNVSVWGPDPHSAVTITPILQIHFYKPRKQAESKSSSHLCIWILVALSVPTQLQTISLQMPTVQTQEQTASPCHTKHSLLLQQKKKRSRKTIKTEMILGFLLMFVIPFHSG